MNNTPLSLPMLRPLLMLQHLGRALLRMALPRITSRLFAMLLLVFSLTAPARANFDAFVQSLWSEAQSNGITRETFDMAFRGVSMDPSIISLTKKQAEFVKPIWSYVESAASASRISKGQSMASEWESALARAERSTGVDRRAILGIWGMETHFGGFTGDKYVIRSLATLAYAKYRGTFFRDELMVALQILQEGHVSREYMRGSWAGAMGQTQFMPSSFTKYAIDGDGDGIKNIWSNYHDAIASTANYLKQHGWQSGLPWGVEVALPQNFDFANNFGKRDFSSWASLGLTRPDGQAMPRRGEASLYLPAGAKGPAFLVTENFKVIKKYNSSDAYAMGVGHLGDRIYGGAEIQQDWPKREKRLSMGEIKQVQQGLLNKGYRIEKIDGKFGEQSREALRQFQAQQGMLADGYPNAAVLARLKGGAAPAKKAPKMAEDSQEPKATQQKQNAAKASPQKASATKTMPKAKAKKPEPDDDE